MAVNILLIVFLLISVGNLAFSADEEHIKSLEERVEQGDAFGQWLLGMMYYAGTGNYNGERVIKDYKKALKWFRKAAEQGRADAQYNLGSSMTTSMIILRPLNGLASLWDFLKENQM